VKVRVGFDSLDPRILPQMGVKVAFKAGASEGAQPARTIVVPQAALQQQDGRDFVWIFQNGRVERRAVTTLATRNDEVTLAAGVNSGEKVVINPPAGLTDGAAVAEEKS